MCRCDCGWVCEGHPDEPFPHGDCPGPGVPCPEPGCELSLAGLGRDDPAVGERLDAQAAAGGWEVVCRAHGG